MSGVTPKARKCGSGTGTTHKFLVAAGGGGNQKFRPLAKKFGNTHNLLIQATITELAFAKYISRRCTKN
jgi:hypothetical protein